MKRNLLLHVECKECVEKYCADWHDYCECEVEE